MKKNNLAPLYIVGSGGLARELSLLVKTIGAFEVKGFIDNDPTATSVEGLPVIRESEFLAQTALQKNDINLAIGIGQPSVIKKLSGVFQGYQFPNLIHPANFGDFAGMTLGQGNIITAGCSFTLGISIGSFNYFNLNCTVGHDCEFENFNVINPGTNISGGVKVGSENLIGTGATILQYLKIGSQSILGAGGVLTEDLASKKLAVGVPAKVIKEL